MHEKEKPPAAATDRVATIKGDFVTILPHPFYEVFPKNNPQVDLRRYHTLIRRGVPHDEAEQMVMDDWRRRWEQAVIAHVTGHFLARGTDPALTAHVVGGWAMQTRDLDADDIKATIEWVTEKELERLEVLEHGNRLRTAG